MGRQLTCGFEVGAFAGETNELGGLKTYGTTPAAYSTAQVRSGARSLLVSGGASAADTNAIATSSGIAWTSSTTLYARAAVYATTLPTTTDLLILEFSDNAHGVQLSVSSAGIAAQDWSNDSTAFTCGSLPTGGWHVLELSYVPSTGATVVQLDGTQIASGTVEAMTASTAYPYLMDEPTGTCTVYLDDWAVNDNTGTAQNSWCGQGQVVLLLPTADSSNTGFKTGAGGTTSLFDAVNNTPPIGVAQGSATATSQIEDATSSSTNNYVATLQTYTAAGVPSGATIELCKAMVSHGWSGTNSRADGISSTANPVIAEATGNSTGAAAGTWPSNWTMIGTAYSYTPSVALTAAPTLKFRKGYAGTAYAMACFMGMVVEYLPTPPVPVSTLTLSSSTFTTTSPGSISGSVFSGDTSPSYVQILQSDSEYALEGSAVYFRFGGIMASPSNSNEVYVGMTDTGTDPYYGGNSIGFYISSDYNAGSSFTAYYAIAGTDTSGSFVAPGSGVTPYWLRIRETGGTVYWDTAPDSGGSPGTWTNLQSVADPLSSTLMNGMYFALTSGHYTSGDTPASITIDSLNGASAPSGYTWVLCV